MATLKIVDLYSFGSNLLIDSEGFLTDLSEVEQLKI
jgi:hypothetical protein